MSLRRLRDRILLLGSPAYYALRLPYLTFRAWRERGPRATLSSIADRLVGTERSRFQRWMLTNEPDESALDAQRGASKEQGSRPLISIVTPVFETPVDVLHSTIRSVLEQTYDNWELCIANGSADSTDVRNALETYTRQDPRIKVTHLPRNLGIAGNANAAGALASGDFVGFLDHDDLLAPFALFEVVKAIAGHPAVDVIYSDEDKIGPTGDQRNTPFFKPAFSPDFLEAVNYMPHFLLIRRALGERLGWFRDGFEGAQDYDLILRAVEAAREIAHIPRILYHWRAWTRSTALAESAKNTAIAAGKRALQEHFRRLGLVGAVEEGPWPTTYRVTRNLPSTPLVSIIIPNRDHADDLGKCIGSIRQRSTYKHIELVVVENDSREKATRKLYAALQDLPNFRLLPDSTQPFNYSEANNFGAANATGEVLLFLNNDTTVITPGWLERMLENILRPEVGVVGAKLYYPNDTVQHAGVILGIGGFAAHAHYHFPRGSPGYFCRLKLQQNLSAVTGACMMIRKQVFETVGGFDPAYALALGDVDLCLRILAKGYLAVYTPAAELYHHESRTRGPELGRRREQRFEREIHIFQQRWSTELARGDDYYNPNLSQRRPDFSINMEPVRALARCKPGFRAPQAQSTPVGSTLRSL